MKTYTRAQKERALRYAKRNKAINLLGGKCSSCGIDNFFVLEFHHNNDTKEKIVSELLLGRWSLVEKEIKSCELLCRNCHIQFHFPVNRLRKKKALDIIEKYCCERCGFKPEFFSSLDFHHKDRDLKSFQVGDRLSGGWKIEDIVGEIEKCELLCRNCHALEHIDFEKYYTIEKLIDYKLKNYSEYGCIDIDVLRVLYCERGLTHMKIGKILGHTENTIRKYVKKNGLVKFQTLKYIGDEDKEILRLHEQGMGTRTIAKKTNCSRGKVQWRLKKWNVTGFIQKQKFLR